MDIPNGMYRTSIKALILDNQKRFLLCKEDDNWEIPGGALDFGENVEECLKREIKEEMGLIVTDIDHKPSYFYSFLNNRGFWTTNIVYKIRVKDLKITRSEECSEIRFFTIEEAEKENLLPSVKKFIKVINEK